MQTLPQDHVSYVAIPSWFDHRIGNIYHTDLLFRHFSRQTRHQWPFYRPQVTDIFSDRNDRQTNSRGNEEEKNKF